jgi:hypothetical protein
LSHSSIIGAPKQTNNLFNRGEKLAGTDRLLLKNKIINNKTAVTKILTRQLLVDG